MSAQADAHLLTDRPLWTLSVSRDSGQTGGSKQNVLGTDGLPPLTTHQWPPCQGPRLHRVRKH